MNMFNLQRTIIITALLIAGIAVSAIIDIRYPLGTKTIYCVRSDYKERYSFVLGQKHDFDTAAAPAREVSEDSVGANCASQTLTLHLF